MYQEMLNSRILFLLNLNDYVFENKWHNKEDCMVYQWILIITSRMRVNDRLIEDDLLAMDMCICKMNHS